MLFIFHDNAGGQKGWLSFAPYCVCAAYIKLYSHAGEAGAVPTGNIRIKHAAAIDSILFSRSFKHAASAELCDHATAGAPPKHASAAGGFTVLPCSLDDRCTFLCTLANYSTLHSMIWWRGSTLFM